MILLFNVVSLENIKEFWWLYLSMPFIAAIIGYGTKIVAIKMMFEPIEFFGIKPFLGWQGIIPKKAAIMSAIACDTLTSRLIKPEEIFARLDPERVAQELEKPMLPIVEKITHEVMTHYQPGLWESIPENAKRLLIKQIQRESPDMVRQLMQETKDNLNNVFDLKDMVITNLTRNKKLLNKIFYESGEKEFQFIKHSGIYFGFMIGLVQMIVWMLTQEPLVMPIFGLFTGWFTDWLALKMIFAPQQEKKFLGIFKWQGLFFKRQQEVASAYGALIAKEILTPSNMIESILTGKLSDNLFNMIQKNIQQMVDSQSGILKPIVVFAVGSDKYKAMKNSITENMIKQLPVALKHIEKYAEDAMDIQNTLVTKMQELTPDEFEGVLRPAFKQDEWILITVGAVLGFMVGELQVLLMEFFVLH
ncbi:MAG TPA: hypothetical protein PLJ37_10270 [Chitinophagales bacterium]|nr:hypothetical protein [Chitinophagales bacterium]MCB0512389.1 DUF445 domain-containing protein [Bacteroidota bacterium]MCB9074273.1 DUF445 domain-containing protein [Chitinophagales bacterium]HMU99011.1 hypothetical protein [Chitinophagales bacterium]HMV03481.1 hypothetical protein [Chitinophagales bacterium]